MNKSVQELIGVLFAARDFAHSKHLNAKSYSEHKALGKFYEELIELVDQLAEAWQGKNLMLIGEIKCYQVDFKQESVKGLRTFLDAVENYRKPVTMGCSPLNNIYDTIEETFLSAIYKLTFLK
jgi:hypothetical protein